MNTLLVLVGIPGSGKSTWIRETLVPMTKALVVNPDSLRTLIAGDVSDQSKNKEVWAVAHHMIEQGIRSRLDVVLDATNVSMKTVSDILSRYNRGNVSIVFRFFECDPETSKARIAKDLENGVPRSNVPHDVIDRMYAQFLETKEFILSKDFPIMRV